MQIIISDDAKSAITDIYNYSYNISSNYASRIVNQIYDAIYDLFFFVKLQESEDDIKNGRVCTLEELRQHIDELEAKYANNNIG